MLPAMPITAEVIQSRIAAALPDAQISVRDTTGSGDHYAVTVVSPSFEGQLLIERHRAVYAALGEAMRADIHALALKTVTPAESQQKDKRP
jgi:stress-induced morphogen